MRASPVHVAFETAAPWKVIPRRHPFFRPLPAEPPARSEAGAGDWAGEAAMLLLNPEYTICEIAEHLGFRSADDFVRAFEQATGRSPAAWRGHLTGVGDGVSQENRAPLGRLGTDVQPSRREHRLDRVVCHWQGSPHIARLASVCGGVNE